MKTLIIGLFSLAMLASGAAWGGDGTLPQRNSGLCKGQKNIFVIVIDNNGNRKAYACKEVTGKAITRKTVAERGPMPTRSGPHDLGNVTKYAPATAPDPCITWVSLGTSYTYCW